MNTDLIIRDAVVNDIDTIRVIYNEGIEDRIATLETEVKDEKYMKEWFLNHSGRFKVIVAVEDEHVIGWASLNRYNNRCAYDGVADLSVYVKREGRGKGVGKQLLKSIEGKAIENDFHKIVLFTFPFNELGQQLYKKMGYREVGIFKEQGVLEGKYVDVMAMEKLIRS